MVGYYWIEDLQKKGASKLGKSDFKELKFAYYWSGIHRADIIFSQDGVFHRQKDIKTNQWTPLEILQEMTRPMEFL